MTYVRRPVSVFKQPSSIPSINWEHPIAHGLKFCVVPALSSHLPPDLVTGKFPIINTGVASDFENTIELGDQRTNKAPVRTLKSNGTGTLTYGRTGLDEVVGSFSVFIIGRFDTNATSESFVFNSGENSLGRGFGIALDDATRVLNGFTLYCENGGRASPAFHTLGLNAEAKYHNFGMSVTGDSSSATVDYFAGGNLVDQDTGQANCVPLANANRVTKLFCRRDDTRVLDGGIAAIYVWDRPMSLREYQELNINPWQIFHGQGDTVAKAPAAGGGGSIPIFAYHYNHNLRC